ncbi:MULTISPECIES: YHS domain-containing (seleno)protein [unclassified Rhizobium]|uniref:YHS domain-containing (seleno)protein n=1 Tax=unclassified Rhizobium TaxID=2613769 RepID=UPI000648F75C|nr:MULTISPECIES: YHS domain-containing (seleno)protein [unclassified Rhizobium]MBN8954759.1 YHS domain-containing protein [Rhizobium tropici]OJY72131.1 MAG: tat pathway signal sequence domain protein [Rhizobium sp. 60-20]RKD35939.1 YHS domain-containing protein [Rhizobium sp. WW_1]
MTQSIRHILLSAGVAALAFSSASIVFGGEIYTTDGIAINGYDAVAYFTDHRPVKGSDKFTAPYKGATFYFASAAHRDAFIQNPEHFAPQYGGYCAFGTAQGHKATTEPQAFTVVNDKLYLNYNDMVLKTWRSDIAGYINKANENWETVKAQPSPK